ncbi:MAG: helix-turn-helix domain-containing protein [Gemmatimonadaceae bacterium]
MGGATVSSRVGCVQLSRTELRLFAALFEGRGEVIERHRLLESTWPNASGVEGASVLGVYVHLLRQRLSAIGVASALETIRGTGYRLAR